MTTVLALVISQNNVIAVHGMAVLLIIAGQLYSFCKLDAQETAVVPWQSQRVLHEQLSALSCQSLARTDLNIVSAAPHLSCDDRASLEITGLLFGILSPRVHHIGLPGSVGDLNLSDPLTLTSCQCREANFPPLLHSLNGKVM